MNFITVLRVLNVYLKIQSNQDTSGWNIIKSSSRAVIDYYQYKHNHVSISVLIKHLSLEDLGEEILY